MLLKIVEFYQKMNKKFPGVIAANFFRANEKLDGILEHYDFIKPINKQRVDSILEEIRSFSEKSDDGFSLINK